MWRTLVHKYEWLISQSKRQFIYPGWNKLILNSWCHFYETLMRYFTNFAWWNILLGIIAELLICFFFFFFSISHIACQKKHLECFILYGLLLLLLCLYWKMAVLIILFYSLLILFGLCCSIDRLIQYRKTSNISLTLLCNKIVDHSAVVGRCSNYIFILDLSPDFNGLGKDNCKTNRETFKFWDLVWLKEEVFCGTYTWIYVLDFPIFLSVAVTQAFCLMTPSHYLNKCRFIVN